MAMLYKEWAGQETVAVSSAIATTDVAERTALRTRSRRSTVTSLWPVLFWGTKILVCLPRTKEDMVGFLKGCGLTAFLNVK
ncbi:hypothetical protein BGZ65_009445, partial [Modicella reniformis]